ncbi:MAG: ribonuclease PH, partial [Chloroflexi bacterium]|nr:ribonuclease PH [Chloroflexota bacterium]
ELIEVQGTAEQHPFSREDFDRILALSLRGIDELVEAQKQAIASF